MRSLTFADCEVYPNWSCINFKYHGEYYQYTHTTNYPINQSDVQFFIDSCTIVGFNFIGYDTVIFLMMLAGASNTELYQASFDIINKYKTSWQIIREKQLEPSILDVVDIMQVLKGKAAMKLYGARVHFKKLQELPIDPHKETTGDEQDTLLRYCDNDCDVTEYLWNIVKPEITLREIMSREYGMDLRSKGGAGIAALVLGHEYERITKQAAMVPRIGFDVPYEFKYQKPDWISFKTERFQKVLADIEADTFRLNTDSGHIILGESVDSKIVQLSDRSVKMGIGGLHSIDGPGYYKANDERCIIDFDAASHYPSMILNSGWFPKHLGVEFLDVYRSIVERRLKAKSEGDKNTAESLKLVINSSFGLFSNKYSILYDPNLLLNVTVSGQLSLLMLAERFEEIGLDVISANTDGLVVNPRREDVPYIKGIVQRFEKDTGLTMEDTWYSHYIRRDVNNYFTIYEKFEGTKLKGIFQSGYEDTEHNPTSNIVVDAVVAHFKTGVDVEDYIKQSTDLRDFITVRTVKGGAVKDDVPVGKIVRWYYSCSTTSTINYTSNGNKVPKSKGAMPVMDLPDYFPHEDIDYNVYTTEALELLNDVNKEAKTGRNSRVGIYTKLGLSIVPYPWKGVTTVPEGHDFSAISRVGIQTGHRANTIAIKKIEPCTVVMGEWSFYRFNDKRYPGAMTALSKKLGFEVRYGNAIEIIGPIYGVMQPLPDIIKHAMFNNLGLPQRRKIVDGLEFLL